MSTLPTRLYGTTGSSFVRLEEGPDGWTLAHALPDSGAQCLAVDPSDPDVVYVGLVSDGVRKTTDGGRDLERLRARRRAGVLRRGQRRGRRGLRRDRAERRLPQRRRRADLERARGLARAPVTADVELSPEAVDVARPLDRPRSARRGRAPRRDRAGRVDALDRPRRDLAGPPARRPSRRPLPRLASTGSASRVRGGRRGRGVERRRRAIPGRRATRGGSAATRGP